MPTDKKNLGEVLPKVDTVFDELGFIDKVGTLDMGPNIMDMYKEGEVTEQDLVLPYDDGKRPEPVKDLVPDENGIVLPQYKNLLFGKPHEN